MNLKQILFYALNSNKSISKMQLYEKDFTQNDKGSTNSFVEILIR